MLCNNLFYFFLLLSVFIETLWPPLPQKPNSIGPEGCETCKQLSLLLHPPHSSPAMIGAETRALKGAARLSNHFLLNRESPGGAVLKPDPLRAAP